MAPKLRCRMFEPRYPEVNRLVMGKVKSIVGTEAVVTLLEFNGKEAKVFNSGEVNLAVGRTMPFRVSDGNKKAIILQPDPLSFEDKWLCDMEYSKAKHVHRVLFSVADDRGMNLKDLYKQLEWPSYDKLLKLDEDEAFLNSDMDSDLKEFLLQRIKLMVYVSWRILNPRILQLCLLIQNMDICYAVALTRQLESYLKLKGRLPFDAFLSIQDFVNKAVAQNLVDTEDVSVPDLGPLLDILERGLVLEDDCPFQNSISGDYIRTDGLVFKVDVARLLETGDLPKEMVAFDIIQRLATAPITCSILLYPSYKKNLKRDIIYGPTDDEIAKYEFDSKKLFCHTMLCTGHGVDRGGNKFLECQDSNGDIDAVDQGYVKFAQEATVADYVVMSDFSSPPKKKPKH